MTMIRIPMLSMHSSQIPVRQPRFEKTFSGMYGIQLIASMLNATIYGIAMTMALRYYKYHSKGDTILVKGVVALLLISGSFEVVCTSYQMYDYFVLKFGRKNYSVVAMGKYLGIYFTAFVAQLFYASRIWTVTGHMSRKFRYLTYPVVALSVLQIASGIAQVLLLSQSEIFSGICDKNSNAIFKVMIVQGVSTAACDMAITASFSFIFHSSSSGINSIYGMYNFHVIKMLQI
ncbi:hypothetical protein BDQ17DRAFT_1511624 [Cyathus striatus]|nr:hypothetical protein BDQ17DRAFT_1511624 [Cyathus striatus]